VPGVEHIEAATLRTTLRTFAEVLASHAAAIDRLNVYPVPDGDTGTNMARTLEAVVSELDRAALEMDPTCQAVSHGSLMGARGNSGVILSQILRGMATVLAERPVADARAVADGLREAATAAYAAVMRPVEGTILTVAREAANAAQRVAQTGGSLTDVLTAAHTAGAEALDRTPQLLPVLQEAGVVDAGGAGYLLFFDAVRHVVEGRPLPVPDDVSPAATPAPRPAGPRYEVMYLLEADDAALVSFRAAWDRIGDSIVVVGGDGLWNCHVHTDDVGAAVEAALDCGGRPRAIRVSDLHEEQAAVHLAREAQLLAPARPVTTAVVAVASGPGLALAFREAGAARVVLGGQTMNPSTAELLAAVEAVEAEAVVLLPNNGNVVSVAEAVVGLASRPVVVVPTRSMPAGLAALAAHRGDATAVDDAAAMAEAAGQVRVGEVTQAVRDSGSPAGPIRAGDWLGLAADGVVAVAPDPVAAATAVLARLLGEEGSLLVVTGESAHPADTDAVRAWLQAQHPGVVVEVRDGGQPHYPFLFGAR